MGKILGALLVVVLFFLLFFPRRIPELLRWLGRSLGGARRAGREIMTGREEPGSPLARHEVRVGEIVLARALASSEPSRDEAAARWVADVGARVARHATRREIPYRFYLVEGDEPNAFAVPGGGVVITRPLVELCGTETPDGLACVLGHEIAHIDQRHAVRQLAARAAARTGAGLLTLGRSVLLGNLAGSVEEILVQGYRRDRELEADRAGVALARAAGFDPRAMPRVLRRLEELDPATGSPLWPLGRYFRSHPPIRERIAALEAHRAS